MEANKDDSMVDEVTAMNVLPDTMDQNELHTVHEDLNEDSREDVDPREALPPGEVDNDPPLTPEEMEKLYDQFEMEDDVNYKFDRILDYEFKDGVLLLKARYLDDDIGKHTLTVPFPILKRDVPLEVAHFIRDNVVEDKRGGYYNTWAKHTLKAHARGVRRLYRAYNVDLLYRVYRTRRAKMSKNARTEMQTIHKNKVKMGIEVPRNTREALFVDKQNKNTLWADAIFKEMSGLRRLNVFKFHAPNYKCD
jgi:hypothetical protein